MTVAARLGGDAGQLGRNLRFLAVAATRDDRLALLGRIGDEQRELGHYREAEDSLTEACTLAAELADRRSLVTNLVRLARTMADLNRYDEAHVLLGRALVLTEQAPLTDLRCVALQHLGACLVEMGRRAEAVVAMRGVLELSRAGGDRALIAAAEKALHSLGVQS